MVPSAAHPTCNSPPYSPHWSLYPSTYVAPFVSTAPIIDADPHKPPWSSIPWSSEFDEIRGPRDAPPHTSPDANCTTRMKMCWDDDYLYILARIESDMEVVAQFTERNSPIFQLDSDFEVFLDPAGTCHSYKELELNAINTVWNLMLDRPYADGGTEHSGRVATPGEEGYYEVADQRTATRMLRGRPNDSTGGTKKKSVWSVEIALAHRDTLSRNPWGRPPKVGTHWRVNFSRVEKRGEINWTWQPQRVWDPVERRARGFVDMHRPDAWGYVFFGEEGSSEAGEVEEAAAAGGAEEVPRDATWPARLAAMNIYYAQNVYADRNDGANAPDLGKLADLVDEAIIGPFLEERGGGGIDIFLTGGGTGYVITVVGIDGRIVKLTHERLLTVEAVTGVVEGVESER